MSRKIVIFLWLILYFAATGFAADRKFTLVIDAGHGGHDAGALGRFSKEKNINLKVALAFGRYVESNCPDVKVVYTRKTDVFIPLHERANISNRNKADLFISIHTNALPKGKIARGLETYTLGMNRASDNFDVAARENSVILIEKDYKQRYEGFDPRSSESYIMFEFMQDKNMAQSVELAKVVQRRACASSGRLNKGVKQAGFLVLRETSMPSCLIELGFITTPEEEQYLNSAAGIDALGKGIYQAFADYRSKFDKRVTVPYKADTRQKINIPAVVPQEVGAANTESKSDKRKGNIKTKSGSSLSSGTRSIAVDPQPDGKVAVVDSKSIIAELSDARSGMVKDTSAGDASAGPDRESRQTAKEDIQTIGISVKDSSAAKASGEIKLSQLAKSSQKTIVSRKENRPSETSSLPATDSLTMRSDVTATDCEPVFKVQIMASSRNIRGNDIVFKGLENIGFYEEGGLYKFTYGASADYNEISRLRKGILDKFPEAFVVAFKDGRKMNVAEAIREFKNNRNKK